MKNVLAFFYGPQLLVAIHRWWSLNEIRIAYFGGGNLGQLLVFFSPFFFNDNQVECKKNIRGNIKAKKKKKKEKKIPSRLH